MSGSRQEVTCPICLEQLNPPTLVSSRRVEHADNPTAQLRDPRSPRNRAAADEDEALNILATNAAAEHRVPYSLQCGHVFHQGCITLDSVRHQCPVCKMPAELSAPGITNNLHSASHNPLSQAVDVDWVLNATHRVTSIGV